MKKLFLLIICNKFRMLAEKIDSHCRNNINFGSAINYSIYEKFKLASLRNKSYYE